MVDRSCEQEAYNAQDVVNDLIGRDEASMLRDLTENQEGTKQNAPYIHQQEASCGLRKPPRQRQWQRHLWSPFRGYGLTH
jgi:hypothetical protein